MPDSNSSHNPLGSLPINTLLPKFAIPSIVAYLVTSLYNIVDQIFIGQGVGYLGNAATNVAFPFTTVSTAIALMMGIGTAANFNPNLGAGNEERARRVAGTGLSCLALFSLTLGLIALFFRGPLLNLFGATPEVLPYAKDPHRHYRLRPASMVTFYHWGHSSLVRSRWKSHLSLRWSRTLSSARYSRHHTIWTRCLAFV
ncbi:MAG: MATE family efflux transporter [Flavonifractor plautii]